MGGKDGCKGRIEAATIPDILYLFGQVNFIFISEKSGKSQGILKSDVCGNHDAYLLHIVIFFHFTDVLNECDSGPCINGGTCKDQLGKFECECSNDYSGRQCELGKEFWERYKRIC